MNFHFQKLPKNITMFDLKTEREMMKCQREGRRKRTEKEGSSTENPAALQEAAQRHVSSCVHIFVYLVWTWIFWNILESETQGLHETVRKCLLVGKPGLKAWSREKRLKYISGVTQNLSKRTAMITAWETLSQKTQNPAVERGMSPGLPSYPQSGTRP